MFMVLLIVFFKKNSVDRFFIALIYFKMVLQSPSQVKIHIEISFRD